MFAANDLMVSDEECHFDMCSLCPNIVPDIAQREGSVGQYLTAYVSQ